MLVTTSLNPGAPDFHPQHAPSLPYFPCNNTYATQTFFHHPSSPCFPYTSLMPMFSSAYSYPNSCLPYSALPWKHPPIKTPFYGFSENFPPTHQHLPPLKKPLHVEEVEVSQEGSGAVEEREGDGTVENLPPTQPTCVVYSNYTRFKVRPSFRYSIKGSKRHAAKEKVWVPKGNGKTTFMIKNIPYKYTAEMVLKFLDDHCLEENEKLSRGGQVNEDFMSAYDFFYLPMDFRTRCNRGFAFLNFTSVSGAMRFRKAMNGYNWGALGWNKTCEITYARIQRREELEKHFKRSNFDCETEAYLPAIFDPYRNGSCYFRQTRLGTISAVPKNSNAKGESTSRVVV